MKEDKGKLLGKLNAVKRDTENSSQFKCWHMVVVLEALIYIVRRLP